MSKDLNLPKDRYFAALHRQRARIENDTPLVLEDSDAAGDKYSHASWGLCSKDKEAWPDAADHLWPDEFVEKGRIAPKYLGDNRCPFDEPGRDRLTSSTLGSAGCFYRCRLFQAKKANRPDKKRALVLYDEKIQEILVDIFTRVYAVLVRLAQAPISWGQDFTRHHARKTDQRAWNTSEWRFGGSLGMGGKFWSDVESFRVSCYSEDRTPERAETLRLCNEALKPLHEEYRAFWREHAR
jgi:hypothetical protein